MEWEQSRPARFCPRQERTFSGCSAADLIYLDAWKAFRAAAGKDLS
jgi:hypothetical protein